MACICLGEAPRVPTLNPTDENLILMPSFSDDYLIQPSHIHMFSPHRYMPPTSPACSTDSQASLYSLTSILINLKPQSSSLFISLPILPGSILLVRTDLQQWHLWTGSQFCQFPTILSYIHLAISAPSSTTFLRPKIWKPFSGS